MIVIMNTDLVGCLDSGYMFVYESGSKYNVESQLAIQMLVAGVCTCYGDSEAEI